MRQVNPARSFAQAQQVRQTTAPQEAPLQNPQQAEQFRQLVELTREYRKWQKAYFVKLKKKEFAKDEQHFMMKYQDKIDHLLKQISL